MRDISFSPLLSSPLFSSSSPSKSSYLLSSVRSLFIGLLTKILSNQGGVRRDLVDFAEFRKRVGNKFTPSDSRAFYEFQQRRGKVAAVGAGLLKSEEIIEGVTRVSISNYLKFQEQNFIALMTEARHVEFCF